MTAVIVIPVFNEAATLGDVVVAAARIAPVLVVDDGSVDDSARVAERAGAAVLRHSRRLGKGQALRTGIAAARSRGATLVVTLDGDGQHDPRDVPVLLDAARAAPGTVILGSRFADVGTLPVDRVNAIRVAGFFVAWATGLTIRDTQCGLRVYPIALFDESAPRRGGFVFETEVLVDAAARGWRVREVPVRVIPRAVRRSRFNPLSDGTAIGAYLAARVAARWAAEGGAAAGALVEPFRRARRRARRAAMLREAAPYAGSPARWSLAVGGATAQRVSASVMGWRTEPRVRRAGVAARATFVAPVLLGLLLLQALGGRRLAQLVSALVDRFCAAEGLDANTEPLGAAVGSLGRPR